MCNKIQFLPDCSIKVNDTDWKDRFIKVYILQHFNGVSKYFIKTKPNEEIIFPDQKQDGFYTLATIEVSTNTLDPIYYYKGGFFKGSEPISLQDLVDNSEVKYDYYFSLCHIKKCFIKANENVFSNSCKSKVETYQRDLIWAAINVMEYLIELEQYEKAQEILTKIIDCNGLCPSENCGCNA